MNSHSHASIWPKYGHEATCVMLFALSLGGPELTTWALVRASNQRKRGQLPPRVWMEPPIGIEPMTYSLRVRVGRADPAFGLGG